MAGSISATVGPVTATEPINATNAQIQAALTRYARRLGIPTDGSAQENLAAILRHWIDDVRRVSKEAEAADERAAYEATVQAKVSADNPF